MAANQGVGLIPAHAGSTPNTWTADNRRPAHPRSRGEHFINKMVGDEVRGSSPLTRGAQIKDWNKDTVIGLIPAHAGSTLPGIDTVNKIEAHPRSRGEHSLTPGHHQTVVGSSPLTRGARGWASGEDVPEGLIPAHAGSTVVHTVVNGAPPAHPRSRGEHSPE